MWLESKCLNTSSTSKAETLMQVDDGDEGRLVGEVVRLETFYPNDPGAEAELMSISPNVEKVFGYSLVAWDKPQDQWLQMLYPGDYARAVSASWATSRTGEPLSIECRMVRDDGRLLWVREEETMEIHKDGEIWRATLTVISRPAVPGWTPTSLGAQIVSVLGPAAARDLLRALELPNADPLATIARVHPREDLAWLLELLGDLKMDEPARLRVAGGLRQALGPE